MKLQKWKKKQKKKNQGKTNYGGHQLTTTVFFIFIYPNSRFYKIDNNHNLIYTNTYFD